MTLTQSQLNDQWYVSKNQDQTENTFSHAPKVVYDSEITQAFSIPSENGLDRDTYARFQGGSWFPINYVAPENMTIDQRRKEIQRLVDAHKKVHRCQVNFGRKYSLKDELSPAVRNELNLLVEAQIRAQLEYVVASADFHEPRGAEASGYSDRESDANITGQVVG